MGYNKQYESIWRTHMKKMNPERGSISVFVIIAFIFCMTILINIYWSSTNYQVTVLQAEQRIREIYGTDVNRIDEIKDALDLTEEI